MTLPGLPQQTQKPTTRVDCGSCRKCCTGFQLVALTELDDPAPYLTREIDGYTVLQHKPNGDCIYLGEEGCTIWGRHPLMCREFDCAAFVERLRQGAFKDFRQRLDWGVIREGRKRLAARRRAA